MQKINIHRINNNIYKINEKLKYWASLPKVPISCPAMVHSQRNSLKKLTIKGREKQNCKGPIIIIFDCSFKCNFYG